MNDQDCAAADVEDAWPLTPAQAGMLFHTRAAPESGVYVGQFSALLAADLDLGRFKAAWEEVIARHGALRSLILWEGFDEPVQVVREALAPEWTEVPGDGERSGETAFAAHLAAERARGIDLAAGPTNRFALQLRADGRWRFAWTCHHALADAWSARLVLREAAQAYASSPPAAPAPQFRAFADWMAGRHAATAEAFWRTQLADHAEPCRLQITPPIRPEPPGRERLRLPPETLAALRAAASGLGATLSDLVQAAWAVVLHRATGRDDILFGVAATLRAPEIPGIEEIVGNFVTTLPARFRIDGHAALADMIRARRETALAAMPHGHLAPVAFARLSGLPPGEALFETLVSMSPPEDAEEDGLFAELEARDQSSHPAALLVAPGEGLALTLVHDGARIGAEGARRLLSMMGEALTRLPGALDAPPADLPVMSPAALAAAEAGEAGPPPPDHALVHAEIARRAQETPDAMAVATASGALTCAELDRQAALWARRLAARGLGPGDRIAVLVERGPLMPVALLAALKAGCAYVPLDAAYPEARIAAMLEAAAPGAVLTTADLATRALGALVLDRPADHLPESAPRPAGPEDPAYVIFTSGSTGAPKGVVIRHRSLAASTAARGPVYGRAPERFLLLSSFAFDSSVVGLFWTLAGGGTLHLPPPGAETDPAALAEIIAAQRITHTLCLPSVLDLLLNQPAAALASLDTVIAAGEPLPRAVADRFAAALPGARLFNEYGPTEATVWCLAQEVGPGEGPVPVGRPIPGARVLIRDARGRPVPDGLPGELLVGGAGVAAGYLGRPDLTEACFPLDPDRLSPGARLYRTGDLVRRRPDGTLVCLGRIDDQTKIRGHRVEPGEVEAALLALPGVEEAAVVAWGGGAGAEGAGAFLAAYLRAAPGGTPQPEALREGLRRSLPDWMIPARWRLMEALPRLPSGKIDRAALPPPDPEVPAGPREAPRSVLEQRLAEVWRQVLWLDRELGATEDFFELGGHSLLAMRLVDAIERELNLRLPPAALSRMTTIRDMAAALEAPAPPSPAAPERRRDAPLPPATPPPGPFDGLTEAERRGLRAYLAGWPGERLGEDSTLFRLNGDGTRPPLFWCFNAAGEFPALAERLGPDQPLFGLRSGEALLDLSPAREQAEHRRLALHVLPDLLRAHPEGPFLLGGNCQGASVGMELALLLTGLGRQVALLALLEAVPLRAYDGPVALIFGRESDLSPFTRFAAPERGWAARFRRHTVDVIPGRHGTYFLDPNLPVLAATLERRIAEALAAPSAPLPVAGFAVEWLSAEAPGPWPAGARRAVAVKLRNAGPAFWGAAAESGLHLAARWIGPEGGGPAGPEATAPLPRGLAPGAALSVEIALAAPPRPGRFTLEIDLVEEGLARFRDMGCPPQRVPVEIGEATLRLNLPRRAWRGLKRRLRRRG